MGVTERFIKTNPPTKITFFKEVSKKMVKEEMLYEDEEEYDDGDGVNAVDDEESEDEDEDSKEEGDDSTDEDSDEGDDDTDSSDQDDSSDDVNIDDEL